MLHRRTGHRDSFKDGGAAVIKNLDQRPRLNPRVYASQLLSLAAARRTIQLLDTFNNNNLQNQHIMWFVILSPLKAIYFNRDPRLALYYPLSASLMLFANILSNPQDQHAASDIHLMSLITLFISQSVQPGTSFAATPTLSMFKELYGIATRLVERVARQSSQKTKRLPETDDPAQSDFVSLSSVQRVSDKSLYSDSNTQTTTSPVSSSFHHTFT